MLPTLKSAGWKPGAAVALAAGVTLVYLNGLQGSFHSDDYVRIQLNPALEQGPDFWRFPPERRQWIEATLALNYFWGGLDPFGYHLFNLLLHLATVALAGALVWLTLRRGWGWEADAAFRVAWITAALFGLHPVHTETVTYILGRTSGQSGLFGLAALLAFAWASLKSTPPALRLAGGLATFAAFTAAVLSKETSLSLLLALPLYDACFMRTPAWVPRKRRWQGVYGPLALLALGLLGLSSAWREFSAGWLARLDWSLPAEQLPVLAHALRLLLFPINLTFDYDFPARSFLSGKAQLAAASLWALLLFGAWRLRGRQPPVLSFALAWFLILLGPTNSIFPRIDLLSERNLYLPAFGLCWAAAMALEKLRARRFPRSIPWALAGTLACFAILVVLRNEVYRNDVSLWQDTVSKSPNKSEVRYYLAMAYSQAGDAVRTRRELARLNVRDPELARVAWEASRPDDTDVAAYLHLLQDLKQRLAAHPDQLARYGTIYQELEALGRGQGRLYHTRLLLGAEAAERGDQRRAELEFTRARDTRPERPEAYLNLGVLDARRGRLERARHWLEEAGRRLDQAPELRGQWLWNTGQVLIALGRTETARELLERHLQAGDPQPEARLMLGTLEQQSGNPEKAVAHWLQVNDPPALKAEARFRIARLRLDQRRWPEAQAALEEALALRPDWPAARFNLAKMLVERGGDRRRARELLTPLLKLSAPAGRQQAVRDLLARTGSDHGDP